MLEGVCRPPSPGDTSHSSWRHVNPRDNSADIASLGCYPQQQFSSTLWWSSPSWFIHLRSTGQPPLSKPTRTCQIHHSLYRFANLHSPAGGSSKDSTLYFSVLLLDQMQQCNLQVGDVVVICDETLTADSTLSIGRIIWF